MKKLNILVSIDGVAKFFDEMYAATVEAALSDIKQAYWGEVLLIQYGWAS